jgi:hypothetical protein
MIECAKDSGHHRDKVIWFAQYSILIYAAYGVAALILTPNMVLWAPKVAYHGSLTGTLSTTRPLQHSLASVRSCGSVLPFPRYNRFDFHRFGLCC